MVDKATRQRLKEQAALQKAQKAAKEKPPAPAPATLPVMAAAVATVATAGMPVHTKIMKPIKPYKKPKIHETVNGELDRKRRIKPRLPVGSKYSTVYVSDGVWVGTLEIPGAPVFTLTKPGVMSVIEKLDGMYRKYLEDQKKEAP